MRSTKRMFLVIICLTVLVSLTGCSRYKQFDRINRAQSMTIMNLNDEVKTLNGELDRASKATSNLSRTKSLLERRLQDEMRKGDLTVNMGDKGLVVTVLNSVLFDSGQAVLKQSSSQTLLKVGRVLVEEVPDKKILIEGHTDSDPIKHSGYRSNWELSTARATEVLHFFIEQASINPERFVVSGFGEYKSVASNATSGGKAQNRRVEIVISNDDYMTVSS